MLQDGTPILGQCGSWVPQMDLKKKEKAFGMFNEAWSKQTESYVLEGIKLENF